MKYDVLIVGSGAGFNVAKRLSKAGVRVALVEQGPLGGTCVNRGCIPSKMLIYPTMLADRIQQAGRIDVEAEFKGIHWTQLVDRVAAAATRTADRTLTAVTKWEGLDVYQHQGCFVDGGAMQVGEHTLEADRIVLAVGAQSRQLDVPGLAGTPYMTSEDALTRRQLPKSLLIAGGGLIAVELGSLYAMAGCEVTVVVRSELLRQEDLTVRKRHREQFMKRVEVLEHTDLLSVGYSDGLFEVELEPGGRRQAEALLVAAGVTPNTQDLGLEHLGVACDAKGAIQVDASLKAAESVWAIGDCKGGPLYRHTANEEAAYVADQLLGGKEQPFVRRPVPHAVFSIPQIGSFGPTEQQLQEAGTPYVAAAISYAQAPQAVARGVEDGVFKLMAHAETGQLLAAHACGEEASELVHLPGVYITQGGHVRDLLNLTVIHPTMMELCQMAARELSKQLPRR